MAPILQAFFVTRHCYKVDCTVVYYNSAAVISRLFTIRAWSRGMACCHDHAAIVEPAHCCRPAYRAVLLNLTYSCTHVLLYSCTAVLMCTILLYRYVPGMYVHPKTGTSILTCSISTQNRYTLELFKYIKITPHERCVWSWQIPNMFFVEPEQWACGFQSPNNLVYVRV